MLFVVSFLVFCCINVCVFNFDMLVVPSFKVLFCFGSFLPTVVLQGLLPSFLHSTFVTFKANSVIFTLLITRSFTNFPFCLCLLMHPGITSFVVSFLVFCCINICVFNFDMLLVTFLAFFSV